MRTSPVVLDSLDADGVRLETVKVRANEEIDEDWLQKLLYRHPELLPVEVFDDMYAPPVPLGREIQSGRGGIDNLYVSPAGGITIVETKLWKNPDSHREVVVQIIDYAKELAKWDYDHFRKVVEGASGKREGTEKFVLEEKMGPALARKQIELHEFRENVQTCLERGDFLLLIVGERISPNVSLLTEAIQSVPGLAFSFGLVEMKLCAMHAGDKWPLLVIPEVVGRTVEKTRSIVRIEYVKEMPRVTSYVPEETGGTATEKDTAVPFSEEGVFQDMAALPLSEGQIQVAHHILNWMKKRYQNVSFWRGGRLGGFTGDLFEGQSGCPFRVKSNGTLLVNLKWLAEMAPPFDDKDLRDQLRERLNQIDGVELPDEAIRVQPKFSLDSLSSRSELASFLETADWCVDLVLAKQPGD